MRLQQFRQYVAGDKLNGFLVTQPQNRRYLSGFTGSAGVLIITQDKQLVATDSRYYEQVRQECPEWELFEVGKDFNDKLLPLLLELGLGAGEIGFEAEDVNVATLHNWQRAIKGRLVLVPTEGAVEELRMRKDPDEVARLKKAIALADEALVHVTDWIQPGMTEAQVAWELESYMRTHGASAISFELIVASGPNSVKPHARVTDRPLQMGEPITMDLGCVVDGYSSDLTRTVCLDQPSDDRYLTIWNTVLQAQQAALTGAKAGMTGDAVDKLARDIIIEAGYGDFFGHGLGHSIGLAIHERPRFSPIYTDSIPAGAVVTVEPGIYIPGWGGVRIEDVVLVQEDGVENLTKAPKEAVLPR